MTVITLGAKGKLKKGEPDKTNSQSFFNFLIIRYFKSDENFAPS
jgi:hypothetical protein